MSQHDLTIDNQTFPATRADLNLALKALSECQSGSTAPTHLANGVLWLDTTTDPAVFKMYNSGAPSLWIILGSVDIANGVFKPAEFTAAGLALLNDVDAAAQRTTLGLGTAATTAATAYATAAQGAKADAAAPKASPTFTGVPVAPTAAPATDSTQIATTAFVAAGLASIPAPSAPTTAQVLAATAGAGYGAVGTYAFLAFSTYTVTRAVNSTHAAGVLRWSSSSGSTVSSTGLAGTWRLLGTTGASLSTRASVFLRIS